VHFASTSVALTLEGNLPFSSPMPFALFAAYFLRTKYMNKLTLKVKSEKFTCCLDFNILPLAGILN
jgi:hypothetical protein